jgi:hypothetical protein
MRCDPREHEDPRDSGGPSRGRYRTRTDDLFRVKEARYQLRQSPKAPWGRVMILPDAVVAHESEAQTRAGGSRFCTWASIG